MTVSYNKLWKLLIDRKLSPADLRKETNMAPNTLTRLRKDEPVSMNVLMSICDYLDCDIGDVCEFVQEYISYTTVDGAVVQTKVPKSAAEIAPNAFSGLSELASIELPPRVTKVGAWAFYWCSAMREITLPETITELGDGVFHRCSALEAIVLPPKLRSIRRDLFHMCSALHSVFIPDGVTEIGDCAFSVCRSLTSLVLPASLRTIGEAAFSGCRSLTALRIPESVTSIGTHAFDWCNSLTGMHLPASVSAIGDCAFVDCDNLEAITVAPENRHYCDLDGVLYTADGSVLLAYPKARGAAAYAVDARTTKIAEGAFRDCYDLVHVVLPDTVEEIGPGAFWCCNRLQTLELPDTVKTIAKEAFWGCQNLTISVRSAETGECRYKIWIGMDGEAMAARDTLARPWSTVRGYHFAEMDAFFPNMNRPENQIMTALTRIEYPEQLSEESRQRYLAFLKENAAAVVGRIIDLEDQKRLERFVQYDFLSPKKLDETIAYAQTKQATQFISYLMQYRHTQFGHAEEEMEL